MKLGLSIAAALMSCFFLSGCASVPSSPYGHTTSIKTQQDTGTSLIEALHKTRLQAKTSPRDIEKQQRYFYYQNRWAQTQVALVQQALRNNQYDQALHELDALLQEEPEYPQASSLRNMITQKHIDHQRLQEAQQLFEDKKYHEAYHQVVLVLEHSPDNIAALSLQAKLMQHQLEMHKDTDQAMDALLRTDISLSYKEASLSQVFNSLSQLTHINFFFDPDINLNKSISFFIQKSTAKEALNGILESAELLKRATGENSLFLYPKSKESHYAKVMIRAFPITHTDPKSIAASLRTLLNLRDISVDDNQQTIIIKDTSDKLAAAERIILLQDQPSPEVELEMSIIELSKTQALNMGLNWPTSLTLSPLAAATGGATNTNTTLYDLRHLNSQRIAAQLSVSLMAQDTNGSAQILANPRIRVKNNQKAKIQIGNRYPIISSTSTSTGLVSDNVSFVDVGLKLEVTPNISEDNEVTLNVNLEVSNIINQLRSKEGNPIYVIGNRNAMTILRLRNEETQILGGLISSNLKKSGGGLPGVNRLPLLGYLFGTHQHEDTESEVILSITPHIIRSGYNFNASVTPIVTQDNAPSGRRTPPALLSTGAPNGFLGSASDNSPGTQPLRRRLQHQDQADASPSAESPRHHPMQANHATESASEIHRTPPSSLYGNS